MPCSSPKPPHCLFNGRDEGADREVNLLVHLTPKNAEISASVNRKHMAISVVNSAMPMVSAKKRNASFIFFLLINWLAGKGC